MLGASGHGFKVNFCKFTNETRLYLEELGAETGVESLAALAGTASGGGYELALACDEIVARGRRGERRELPRGAAPRRPSRDRRAHAPRRQAQGAPRPGGRVLDDGRGRAGQRALVEWGLVDEAPTRREFEAAVRRRLDAMVARSRRRAGKADRARAARRVPPRVDRERRPDARGHADGVRARGSRAREPRGAGAGRLGRVGHPRMARARRRAARSALQPPHIGVVALKTSGRPRQACSPSTRCSRSTTTTGSSARSRS